MEILHAVYIFVQKISSKLEPAQSKTKPISDMATSLHSISPVQKTSPSDRGVERETGNKATSQEKLGLTEISSSLVGGFNPSEKYSSNWKSSPNRGENMEYLKPPPSYSYTSLNFPCVPFQSFNIDMLKWCFWSASFLKLRQFHTWMESLMENQKKSDPNSCYVNGPKDPPTLRDVIVVCAVSTG